MCGPLVQRIEVPAKYRVETRRRRARNVGLVSDGALTLLHLHAHIGDTEHGSPPMLTSPLLEQAWSVLLDQFAHRYAEAPVPQGAETAAQIRRLQGLLPHWDFIDHDVVLAESLAPRSRHERPLVRLRAGGGWPGPWGGGRLRPSSWEPNRE